MAVAGRFYPHDAAALRSFVERELEHAVGRVGTALSPEAIVAPHAGYVYSGSIAASAYATMLPLRGAVERVVLLGPAHFVPLTSIAAPSAAMFQTPLGAACVDTVTRDQLVADGVVTVDDAAHAREHSLVVHLPFVQVALGDVQLIPLLVGRVPTSDVVAMLRRLWNGPETRVVVSTDLSHYHGQATATRLDQRTASAIVAKRAQDLASDDACGLFPLRGLVAFADQRGFDIVLLDLRTSADTAGGPESVVGYGSFAVCS